MFVFILRRCAYSVLIMLGVLILTFVLFRVAAGDPAAAVLGKNPSPEELENMRMRLGSDKPLFFGGWRNTAVYPEADFSNSRTSFAGISYGGTVKASAEGLLLQPGASIRFQRGFAIPDPVRMNAEFSGTLALNGKPASSENGSFRKVIASPPGSAELKNVSEKPVLIRKISFQRPAKHFFDSQLTDSIAELVSFKKEFPYVSFFNFGETLLTRTPIREVLWSGMQASLLLMLPIFFGELFAGIVLAMVSAACRGKWPDHIIMLLSVAGMSISYLALIIFCQWLFGYYWNLFPVWGWDSPRHLLLPVIVGIISGTGSGVRFYRTVFLNEMNREYLRTAAAKGCSSTVICFKHLLRNAAIPIITRASTILPFLFTGSLLLESFFGIPGLGFRGVDALNSSDLQTLKALVILSAFLFVIINLLADLAYAWADPRVRQY